MRMLKAGRGFFFLIGLIGLTLLVLSFWIDTEKMGGILCAAALIGHMATWRIRFEDKNLPETEGSNQPN